MPQAEQHTQEKLQLLRDAGLNKVKAITTHGSGGAIDHIDRRISETDRPHNVQIYKTGSKLQVVTNLEHLGVLRNSELPSLSLRLWSWLNDGTIPNSILQPEVAQQLTDNYKAIPVVPILRKKNGEYAAYFRSQDKKDNSALSAFAGLSVASHAKLLDCEFSSMHQRYIEYPLKVGILTNILKKLELAGFAADQIESITDGIESCRIKDLWQRLEAIETLAQLLRFPPQVIEETTIEQRRVLLTLKVFTQLLKTETLLDLVKIAHGHFYNLGNATAFYVDTEKTNQLLNQDPTLSINNIVEHQEVIELDPRKIADDVQKFSTYEPLVLPIDFDRASFSPIYPEHLENSIEVENLLKLLDSANDQEVLMAIHYLPLSQWQEHVIPRFSQMSPYLQRNTIYYLRTANAEISSGERYQQCLETIYSLTSQTKEPKLVEYLFSPIINLETRRFYNMEPYGVLEKIGYTQLPSDAETEKWYQSSDVEQFLLALAINDDLWLRDDVVNKITALPSHLQFSCVFFLYRNGHSLFEKMIDANSSVRDYIVELTQSQDWSLQNAALVIARDYNRSKTTYGELDKVIASVSEEEPNVIQPTPQENPLNGKSKLPAFLRRIMQAFQG